MGSVNMLTSLSFCTDRGQTESGRRGRGWKRRAQAELTGPERKRCHQAQTTRAYNATSFKDDDSEDRRYQMPHTNSEHASFGFTKGVTHNHSEAGYVGNKGCSLERINQPMRQLVNPVCSLLSDSVSAMSSSAAPHTHCPSAAHAHEQEPAISSHKGFAVVATENSVLKTLFLSLSPFQQDGEQQDSIQTRVPSESEKKGKSSTDCVFVKQKKSKKKGRQKKKLKTQHSHKQSTEKTAARSTKHQPSPHTPQISFKATGWSILSPGMTEPQVRNSGTNNLPLKPEVPPTQHHTRPSLKHTSEEVCGNGNVVPTPLKDLFKTLDTTIHFGC
ncbi:hypothetical protein L3Q82_005223 [Scortum barcoo]|uniref:Uncharacterized protein n=1 Tax=Scortum barcoo TaxID=214431 RepID=A0ACB8VBH7_9TELE|nr:hypothetical protein L3Q82_005223 [Scortum barcoo]